MCYSRVPWGDRLWDGVRVVKEGVRVVKEGVRVSVQLGLEERAEPYLTPILYPEPEP